MQLYVGIDPGRATGGIAILAEQRGVAVIQELLTMPGEMKEIKRLAQSLINKNAIITLENPGPDPRWSAKSAWSFAQHIGILKAYFDTAQLVAPKTWQARLVAHIDHDEPKQRALMFARDLWPKANWYASSRCAKEHNGLVDACVIAYYGYVTAKDV